MLILTQYYLDILSRLQYCPAVKKKQNENTLTRIHFEALLEKKFFSFSHLKWQNTYKICKIHEIWAKMAKNRGTPPFFTFSCWCEKLLELTAPPSSVKFLHFFSHLSLILEYFLLKLNGVGIIG